MTAPMSTTPTANHRARVTWTLPVASATSTLPLIPEHANHRAVLGYACLSGNSGNLRTPGPVFIYNVPRSINLFHQHVLTATAKATKVVNIEHPLRVSGIEADT